MKIKRAIVPVAGKGTRFLPATKQIPKEMIPVVNKPMIHYAIEELYESGIEQIIFVSSYGKGCIEDYFDRNFELEFFLSDKNKNKELELIKEIGSKIDVVTVRQKEQLGLGHAILCAEEVVGQNDFVVLLADDLIMNKEPVTKQLIDISYSQKNSPVIGVMEVDKKDVSKYGIVDGSFIDKKTLKMKKMVEKPSPENAPTNLATPGRYILNKDIFSFLKKIERGAGGEYQLTDAINMMCAEQEVFAHIYEGERFDTGSIEGYLKATVDFALRDEKTKSIMESIIESTYEKIKA